MSLNDIKNKIAGKREELNALKEEYTKVFRKEFHNIIKSFFEEVPEVQAIIWSQYTPYFNDGDPCVFGIGDIFYVTKNFDIEDRKSPYYYVDDEYGCIRTYAWCADEASEFISDEKYNRVKEFTKIITDNEDLMEELYGDPAAVYITKDSVIVDEYEHD